MRFNHMELTFAPGTLTDETRRSIDDFYGTVFGWRGSDIPLLGQMCHLLALDKQADQFILLAESKRPIVAPGFDHLGLLQDTRAEVDEMLARCQTYQERDDRVQIKNYDDIVSPKATVRAFYVKYLLPIWFDVQTIERGQTVPG